MGNLLRNVRDMGRKIGRSMLKMNEREKERKRKAKRYFGEEPDIMPSNEKVGQEKIMGTGEEDKFEIKEEKFFEEEEEGY